MSLYEHIFRPRLQRISLRCSIWCRKNMTARSRVLMVCIVTSVTAGVGAWLLKTLIGGLSSFLTSGLGENWGHWPLWVCPALGILLTGLLQRRVFHRRIDEGTERVHAEVKAKRYTLPHQLTYEPIMGCVVTVGMGGSAGAEGPIAYAGAAIGSNSARFFGLGQDMMRMMIGIGAGAGIAAIFKAPLAGVLYTLEVLGLNLTSIPVLILVTCCLISAGSVYALTGFREDIVWEGGLPHFDYSNILWLIGIGIMTGIYCRWYSGSGKVIGNMLTRMKSPLLRNLCAGFGLGAVIWCFPTMFGEGYTSIEKMLAGDLTSIVTYSPFEGGDMSLTVPLMLGGILLLKGMSVSATDKGGGIAGTFAPTLFAGCMAGTLIAYGAHWAGCDIPSSQIAYVCMAGAMAGIIEAPLMATFITVEVTMTYSLLLPVAIVAFTAFATNRILMHSKREEKRHKNKLMLNQDKETLSNSTDI